MRESDFRYWVAWLLPCFGLHVPAKVKSQKAILTTTVVASADMTAERRRLNAPNAVMFYQVL